MTISVSAVYPSPWISPDDVGRPITVTIAAVTVEEFRRPDGSQEHKIVLAFKGARKRLPLNKTQAKTLAGLLGDDAEKWAGRTIILAPAMAPNRKATIAVGTPKHEPAVTAGSAGPQDETCETCGQVATHHTDCPEA